ncbi:type IX secretion system membrane protein PorP/SprF [Adhaeribacter swui]|uniref:Type IX secretion system membrane protein PorP/SprF n=2 Tax=Adhaeribacter swui TaxID=2086471 RepID=A0A7G7G5Q8_9BACT|nr:type IX secretion system membrane protein PorP/SprF [Adhaeribacter swui]
MQKVLLVIMGALLSLNGWAQQNAQYTQYIFNGLGINPAYAGSKGIINVNGIYRTQWVGLEGAPTTQTISVDGAIAKQKIGLGLLIINDRIGAQGQKSVLTNTAFRINVAENARLALGIAAGISQYYTDGTLLNTNNPTYDPTIPTTKISTLLPDTKAGLFFNTERLYVGLSASNLINFKNKFVATPARHFYLTSGYIIPLNDWLTFKPSFLIKEDFKSPTNIDVNAFMLIGDRVWLGGSYRTGTKTFKNNDQDLDVSNAWALATEIYLSEKVKVGYAHDFTLTSLREYAGHELSLGFYFFRKEESRTLSIRYF